MLSSFQKSVGDEKTAFSLSVWYSRVEVRMKMESVNMFTLPEKVKSFSLEL